MPSRSSTKTRRAPARPAAPRRRPARRRTARRVRRLTLDQRSLDVIGLGLVALGVFMGCVLYGHWDGGAVGDGAASAFAWAFGKVRDGVPLAFAGLGALLVLRPLIGSPKPLRASPLFLFAAATLALAANTLGVAGAAPAGPHRFWVERYFEHRGGIVGQGEDWVATHLVSTLGANLLAVFLFIAGIVLLSGGSLALLVRSFGAGIADASQRLPSVRVPSPPERPRREPRPRPEPIAPPEPDPADLIVRATHVEAPADDGLPDFTDFEPDAQEAPYGPVVFQAKPGRAEPVKDDDGPPGQLELTPQGRFRGSVTDDPGFEWRLPSPGLLTRSSSDQTRPDTEGQARVAARLLEALGHFGINASVVGTVAGPHITRYELRLAPGIKVAKVAQLKDDLAYALAATDVRILAPIPGKQAVGVEVPNAKRRIVRLGDVYQDPPDDWSPLTVWLGKDVAGRAIGADLAKMPHLLVAGTTGSGKSAAVNAMLASVLLRASPHDVRLVLVDPKQVELNHYESIPHLLTPVITSPRMAANALMNLVREMEQRYGIMSLARTRSLPELNRARAERGDPPLPYILCVIDELADLMMVAPADVEDSIIRLAQKARAVGIHLVLATQSPRVDVITGMIKANVPSRIAFAVSSQIDSRVILDQNGAESLLGAGDMLFAPIGSSAAQRIQGAFLDEAQIAAITDHWRAQGEPELREELLEEVEAVAQDGEEADGFDPDEDPLLGQAIELVVEMGTASTSMLQRRLRLGYTRAGRLIDMLERRGIISGYEGSKPRQVLVGEADLPRVLAALEQRPQLSARSTDTGSIDERE
ncbi:MAG TPA: DNA translocase FtsK [Solirubrobacteraceae bacterium]|nr:DNA translocase FtsK [Solirubrobacteraceae bacterium]